jgi:hypothetical protein
MTTLGEFPPLEPLPRDALSYYDVTQIQQLLDEEWSRCDAGRREVHHDTDEYRRLLGRQHWCEATSKKFDAYRVNR